jgi:hypothetical protein
VRSRRDDKTREMARHVERGVVLSLRHGSMNRVNGSWRRDGPRRFEKTQDARLNFLFLNCNPPRLERPAGKW